MLTLATFAGSLTVFLVLILALRALNVPASEVSTVEAFAAWCAKSADQRELIALIGAIPITPGGIGIVEVELSGALIGFGGNNTGVVAAVLVSLPDMVPTLVLGPAAAATWRHHRPPGAGASKGQAADRHRVEAPAGTIDLLTDRLSGGLNPPGPGPGPRRPAQSA